jgi:hypothetical protein
VSKTKGLTPKQAKFIKLRAQGKTQAEAYMASYNTKGHLPTVKPRASKLERQPDIQEALQKELARQGITLETVVRPVAEGLKAEKVTIVGNGEDSMAEITPDHNIRLQSVKIASRWMGIDSPPSEGGTTNNFIQVIKEQSNKYA